VLQMAGAGQPWYMPLTWPVGHVLAAMQYTKDGEEEDDGKKEWHEVPSSVSDKTSEIKKDASGGSTKRGGARRRKPPKKNNNNIKGKKDVVVPQPTATPDLDIIGHLTSFAAATRSFLLAYFCVYYIHGGEDGFGYPAFGSAKEWSFDWMWPIVLRNVLATFMIAGFWDWFLYFSPISKKLKPWKLNPIYPSMTQLKHDAFMSTMASICGSGVEIWLCHAYASGQFPMQRTIAENPYYTLLWAITITHWRIPHFWLLHRSMHPWKKSWIPKSLDPGRFLYRYVHSLHHKSHNPTAFSGTNMHPIEATGYYSASLICLIGTCHPTIALGCIIDCAVGAWLGHDGYQWPGSGDYFHQLHHQHFDCNFGAMHVPIDKWLGTYAGKREDIKEIWSGKPAGAEANKDDGFTVHESSKKNNGVE
jgi:sterol desaturase/sphingolipid hydroxylase (fatty acid hydroxylase superfamily)